MSTRLDFCLFGHGHGLKSPYFDDTFYWLVDTLRQNRNGKNGRFYSWIGGFGAQLKSYEWTAPPAGTERQLIGRVFRVFQTRRHWLKVEVSWALVQSGQITIDQVRELRTELCQEA